MTTDSYHSSMTHTSKTGNGETEWRNINHCDPIVAGRYTTAGPAFTNKF